LKFLVITQSTNRAGRTVQVKKEVNADWLRVGRAASSEVLLADPRVALNEGFIVDRNGLVYTEGDAGVMQGATHHSAHSVPLPPGATLEVGPYRLTSSEPPEGCAGALIVELVRPAENVTPEFLSRTQKLSLRSLRLPKRWAALGLFALIAVVFFLVPAGRVLELPWQQQSSVAIASDRFWNPGPVMLAHQPIEQKCEACHEVAFRQVRDSACLECHQRIGHHVAQDMNPAALFQGTRCAECHRDHKGVKTTHRDDDHFCVDCHKEVRSRANGAQSQNVSDFAKDHPAFRLSIPGEQGVKRVRMGKDPIVETSNLNFPHAVHLDPKGVRHPDDDKVVLQCAACHKPDASKKTFEPVSMEKHCLDCHRLEFEPAVTKRQVPHGPPGDAVTVVNEFYANLALNGVKDSFEKAFGVPGEGLLRRTGQPTEPQRAAALELASKKAAKVSKELIELRVCGTCHAVARKDGPDGRPEWSIAKVRANNLWMPNARFDHKSHAQSKCADCHDVAKSKRSQDVAMPTVESCRECHAGSSPSEKKITSNCFLCHGFHEQKHPWDPTFKPKGKAHVAQGGAVAP